MPGDEYEGYVEVTEDGLQVSKWHIFCPDDFWEEQEEEVRRADEYYEAQREASAQSMAA